MPPHIVGVDTAPSSRFSQKSKVLATSVKHCSHQRRCLTKDSTFRM